MEVTANGKTFTFPDGTDPELIGEAIDEYFVSQPVVPANIAKSSSDVPTGFEGRFPTQPQQEQKTPTAFEEITGAAENVASNTLGVPLQMMGQAAGSLAGIGSTVLEGDYGTMAGAERARGIAEDFGQRANIFAPRTVAGQQIAQQVGEQLAPLSSLPPVMSGISPASAQMRLAKPARPIEASPEAVQAGEIRRGSQSAQLAGVEVSPDDITKTITSKAGKEAMRQGFEAPLVQMVKQSTDIDRAKMNKMLDVTEKAKDEALYGAQNRPSDIAGESLKQRIDFIKSVNRKAGEEIDAAASKLKNETVDYSNSVQSFVDGLDKLGVTVKKDGISFKGSDIDEFPTDKRIIAQTMNRIERARSAEDVHRIKRFIDNKVSYGTKSQGGITRETINVLKELRANIDADLDGKFADYDKANTKYSKTIRAIGDMQDASGTVDLFSDGAEKALGTRLRSLLSNNQNRQSLTNAISELDKVSKEFGGNFSDNVQAQVLFADALERTFKVGAKTGFRGEASQAIRDAADVALGQKTVSGVAMEKAASLIEKARGINEQNAMKSLRELVKEKEVTP